MIKGVGVGGKGKWGWKPRWGPTVTGFCELQRLVVKRGRYKLMIQELNLDVLGLAETFLREEEEASVADYVWYGCNREGCK